MPRILITEDDKFMANICRVKFEEQGYEAMVANDGRAALELLKNRPPDLVVLDLMLPEIDGIEVLKFIRADEKLRRLPVIVLSNSAYFSGPAQSAWQAGATNFLNKGDHSPKALVEEANKLLAAPPLPPAPEFRDPAPAAIRPPDSREPYILVADDDNLIHNVLTFFITQANYEVRSAFNGRRALEMAEADPPALMILDGMMPELDGFEVLQHWTRSPRLAGIPVIMLTARKEPEISTAILEAGAVEYLTKPFSPDKLVALIDAHLGH